MIGLIVYVCSSAVGLTLIKIGTGKDSSFYLGNDGFGLKLSWILILGMCIYLLSFFMSITVMRRMNITVFYPMSAGLIYVLVALLGLVILKETVTTSQFIGMIAILAGIVIMNFGKGTI